jgi:hypothetical protein
LLAGQFNNGHVYSDALASILPDCCPSSARYLTVVLQSVIQDLRTCQQSLARFCLIHGDLTYIWNV